MDAGPGGGRLRKQQFSGESGLTQVQGTEKAICHGANSGLGFKAQLGQIDHLAVKAEV